MWPSHRFRIPTAIAVCAALIVVACGDSSREPVAATTTTTTTVAPTTTAVSAAVTATTAASDPAALSAQMQAVLDGSTARQSVPFSVVVVDIPTGAQASHLADRSVLSASLYKLFVAAS